MALWLAYRFINFKDSDNFRSAYAESRYIDGCSTSNVDKVCAYLHSVMTGCLQLHGFAYHFDVANFDDHMKYPPSLLVSAIELSVTLRVTTIINVSAAFVSSVLAVICIQMGELG